MTGEILGRQNLRKDSEPRRQEADMLEFWRGSTQPRQSTKRLAETDQAKSVQYWDNISAVFGDYQMNVETFLLRKVS